TVASKSPVAGRTITVAPGGIRGAAGAVPVPATTTTPPGEPVAAPRMAGSVARPESGPPADAADSAADRPAASATAAPDVDVVPSPVLPTIFPGGTTSVSVTGMELPLIERMFSGSPCGAGGFAAGSVTLGGSASGGGGAGRT